MFVTSTSTLGISTYLSVTFLVNEGWLRSGPPCLCLCTSLRLAVLVPDLGPVSVSLSTITTAVAGYIAAWLTIAWIPLDSALSTLIWIFTACICMLLWSDYFYSWYHVMLSHPQALQSVCFIDTFIPFSVTFIYSGNLGVSMVNQAITKHFIYRAFYGMNLWNFLTLWDEYMQICVCAIFWNIYEVYIIRNKLWILKL